MSSPGGVPRTSIEAAVSETFAEDWRSAGEYSEFHDSLERAALRHVPPGARVLEIGVGPGYVPLRLHRERRCRAFGLDYLPDALTAAQSRARDLKATIGLVRGSAFSLPFRDESFEAVMSFGLVEHYDQAQTRAMLVEHHRVCRPGGMVLVSVPSSLDVAHSLRRAWLGNNYPYGPERSLSPWHLARELRAVGLVGIKSDGYAPLWGLRQLRLAYPLTALLFKVGLLGYLDRTTRPSILSWMGGFTLQVGRRP